MVRNGMKALRARNEVMAFICIRQRAILDIIVVMNTFAARRGRGWLIGWLLL